MVDYMTELKMLRSYKICRCALPPWHSLPYAMCRATHIDVGKILFQHCMMSNYTNMFGDLRNAKLRSYPPGGYVQWCPLRLSSSI